MKKTIYLLAAILMLTISPFFACAQVFEFPTAQINSAKNAVLKKDLTINLNSKKAKVTEIFRFLGASSDYINDTLLEFEINEIFINEDNLVVATDKSGEPQVGIYVSDDSQNGYFIYYNELEDGFYQVAMTNSERFAPAYFKLRKIAEQGWPGSTSGVSSNSYTSSTSSSVTKSNGVFNIPFDDFLRCPFGLITGKINSKEDYISKVRNNGIKVIAWNSGIVSIDDKNQTFIVDGIKFDDGGSIAYRESYASVTLRTKGQKGEAGKKWALGVVEKWKKALISNGFRLVSENNRMVLEPGNRAYPPNPLELKFQKGSAIIFLHIHSDSHGNVPRKDWNYGVTLIGRFQQ